MRADMPKEMKRAVMDAIEKQSSLIKSAERKEMGKLFTKTVMTEFRILRYVQRFRERYAVKQALQRDRAASTLQRQNILSAGKGVETEEEMLNQRGNLEFATEPYTNPNDLVKIRANAAKLTYQKMYFVFFDDIIAWKKKNTAQAVEGKIFLVSIEEVKVDATHFFLFVALK